MGVIAVLTPRRVRRNERERETGACLCVLDGVSVIQEPTEEGVSCHRRAYRRVDVMLFPGRRARGPAAQPPNQSALARWPAAL
eukprot:scaffold149117_cov31-Tisochrysis_lutea.AAC.1